MCNKLGLSSAKLRLSLASNFSWATLSSWKFILMWDHIRARSSACEVAFFWGCCPVMSSFLRLSSYEAVFLWGHLPVRLNYLHILVNCYFFGWDDQLPYIWRISCHIPVGSAAKYLEDKLPPIWRISCRISGRYAATYLVYSENKARLSSISTEINSCSATAIWGWYLGWIWTQLQKTIFEKLAIHQGSYW